MKRNKLGICALTIGALGFLACLTNGENSSISNNPLLNRNATFLVSLEGTEKSLGNDGVKAVQEEFLNDLRSKVGFNFRVVDTYDAINAIKIQANESLENVIKEAAHVMKGLYDSFIEAGFTMQESLYLIACLIRPNANKN